MRFVGFVNKKTNDKMRATYCYVADQNPETVRRVAVTPAYSRSAGFPNTSMERSEYRRIQVTIG